MLFAALAGTKSDGAKFIPQAVEAGAAAVLTGQQPLPGEYSIPSSASPIRAIPWR